MTGRGRISYTAEAENGKGQDPVIRFLVSCLLLQAACGPAPAPAASEGQVSTFRASFATSMLAACRRELTNLNFPQAEVEFACPCMTREVLANAPTDTDLATRGEELQGKAIEKCAAIAEERFPRP